MGLIHFRWCSFDLKVTEIQMTLHIWKCLISMDTCLLILTNQSLSIYRNKRLVTLPVPPSLGAWLGRDVTRKKITITSLSSFTEVSRRQQGRKTSQVTHPLLTGNFLLVYPPSHISHFIHLYHCLNYLSFVDQFPWILVSAVFANFSRRLQCKTFNCLSWQHKRPFWCLKVVSNI